MTLWSYCPNPDCDAPPLDGDTGCVYNGEECYRCGTVIEAFPPEAYEEPTP